MKKIFKIVFCGLLGISPIGNADLYDVSDIPIVAEMQSAQEARTVAITNGQKDAFWTLMNKMVTPDDLGRVSLPDETVLQDMVQNVSLSDEKNTATRYMAMLSVRFHPDKVQSYLSEGQVPFLTQEMPRTLLIPVFLSGEEVYLLDEQNPVYSFLKKHDEGLNNTVLPIGDLEEAVQVRDIWSSGQLSHFQDLAEKYHADRIMVLSVSQRGPYLTLQTKSVPASDILPDQTEDLIAPMGNVSEALDQAWPKILATESETWRSSHTNDFSAPDTIWIKVPIHTLNEWFFIRQQLNQNIPFDSFNVRGFKPNEVLITIKSREPFEYVENKLKSKGFVLEETDVRGLWKLRTIQGKEDVL